MKFEPTIKHVFVLAAAGLALGAAALAMSVRTGSEEHVGELARAYLLKHPQILSEVSEKLQENQEAEADVQRTAALKRYGMENLFNAPTAYVAGPQNAKTQVVEFFDYRCTHCKNALPAVQKILASGDARVAFIEHPILTPDSVIAAHAAIAARRQAGKYLAFHFALMGTSGALPIERVLDIAQGAGLDVAQLKRDMDDPKTLDVLRRSVALAEDLHFDGTPFFVINGKIIPGEITEDDLPELLK